MSKKALNKKSHLSKVALCAASIFLANCAFAESAAEAVAGEEPSFWSKVTSWFSGDDKQQATAAQPPIDVNAIVVEATPTIAVVKEFVGEISAIQQVEVRARVNGFLEKKYVQDGAIVKKGELLFEIDRRPYLADLANAEAALAQAQSNLVKAQQDVTRYEPLVKEKAISKMDYDHSVAVLNASEASVNAAKASIEIAQLNLGYCKITAPFDGKIGRTKVDEGALISAATSDLATISTEGKARVYFSISEQEYLEVVKHLGKLEVGKIKVKLVLADKSTYDKEGVIDFLDRGIDPLTGTYTFRAEFPNENQFLLPGMYGRIQIALKSIENAIIVPQRAVQETLGTYSITVIKEDGSFESRRVTMGDRIGGFWIVEEGLKSNEKIIVDGFQKLRPHSTLNVKMVEIDKEGRTINPKTEEVPSGK